MAVNLGPLSNITTAATSLANLILVTPSATQGYQPNNPPNPDGTQSTAAQPPSLLFHYDGEQTVSIESDITDHYIEDNTAVEDQIALKPELITTHGFIGELNDVVPDFLKPIKTAADKLTTIGAYTPQLTATALLAYNEAFFLYQVAQNTANAAVSAWTSISDTFTGDSAQSVIGSGGLSVGHTQNKQQTMFQQFYGYWRSRTLFTVQTPWAVFQNMAIQRLRAIQDADTRVITDFEVTFKMIRVAQTTTASGLLGLLGRAASQASGLVDLGTSSPVSGPSLSSGLGTMLG